MEPLPFQMNSEEEKLAKLKESRLIFATINVINDNLVQVKMEEGLRESDNEKRFKFLDIVNDTCFSQFRSGSSNPWIARYVYALIFLVGTLSAWAVRDYGHRLLKGMESLNGCQGVRECLGADGVLRVSLGCSTFFFTMFVSTAGTSKLHEDRDNWHSGWWFTKLVVCIVFVVIPFVLPSQFIEIYGELAHVGAGVFLLIQLISIISFITWLNNHFLDEKNGGRWQIYLMVLGAIAHVICLVGIILMYIWYAAQHTCLLNIFYITGTLMLLQLMINVSLHPKVNAGILAPGLMGLYVVYICWSAIRSEPTERGTCKIRNAEASDETDWQNIISFIIAVLAIVFATFSTGIDSKSFQIKKDVTQEEDDVPYGYGFFHFVFATGAMYFAMLLIGWNTHHSMRKWTIDVGWTSTWVRIVNEWLAVCVYLWMLVAPIVLKDRQQKAST